MILLVDVTALAEYYANEYRDNGIRILTEEEFDEAIALIEERERVYHRIGV